MVGTRGREWGQSREEVEHPDCGLVLEPAGFGSETLHNLLQRQQAEENVSCVGGVTCSVGGFLGEVDVVNILEGGSRDNNDLHNCSHSGAGCCVRRCWTIRFLPVTLCLFFQDRSWEMWTPRSLALLTYSTTALLMASRGCWVCSLLNYTTITFFFSTLLCTKLSGSSPHSCRLSFLLIRPTTHHPHHCDIVQKQTTF